MNSFQSPSNNTARVTPLFGTKMQSFILQTNSLFARNFHFTRVVKRGESPPGPGWVQTATEMTF